MSDTLVAYQEMQDSSSSTNLILLGESPNGSTPLEVWNRLVDGDAPLRAWRKYRGFTQIELSVAAEVKVSQIANVENCESIASDEALKRLATVLGVDWRQLS